jgi:uncharacterized protein YndB with AHSA1/START domain/N-acetylglutamate synthase-like GNAT family acetyltransferase
MTTAPAPTLRTELHPGDLGAVVALHGILYAREHGFDPTFEAYVAEPLGAFALRSSPRERLWLAELDGRLVGCVAIVAASETVAQLRWFVVAPAARGAGLGRRLLGEAVAFARASGYASVTLWTVGALDAAARLYRALGFERVEAVPGRRWGADVTEERYELAFGEIVSTRRFAARREAVYRAFADPAVLARWWGPSGSVNAFEEFDLRPGGSWRFDMRGADGTVYPMVKRFVEVAPAERVVVDHLQEAHGFRMTMTFADEDGGTRLTWRMRFESADEAERVRALVLEANEQNFDRLAAQLASLDPPEA